ncbi:MAG: hypothetical protein ACXWL2_03670 [Candidatus Chromulinivorax sp.]
MKTQNLKLFVLCVTFFACNKFFAMSSEKTALIKEIENLIHKEKRLYGRAEVLNFKSLENFTEKCSSDCYADFNELVPNNAKLKQMSLGQLKQIRKEYDNEKFSKNYPVVHLAKQCFENCFKSKQS